MDKEISKRIWVTRYLMVIGIIVFHLRPSQTLNELGLSFFDLIKAFFTHGVFRASISVLTAISGFLVFRSGIQLKPYKLFLNKTVSLLIPLVLWNIPFVIGIYLSQKYNFISHDFSEKLYPIDPLIWLNALTGLYGTPANYPLNFLRDLFAISLLSPLFWLFLKRTPYFGLLVILVIYYFNLDRMYVLRNSMLVCFYIGGLAASQKWSLTYLDKRAKLLCFIFISYCIAIILFDIQNIELFRLLSPFLVWPSMSLIMNTKFYEFLYDNSNSSFFTFLAHAPIIFILWLVFNKIPINIPYYFYWFLTPPITVCLLIILCRYFKQLLPRLSSIALGGR